MRRVREWFRYHDWYVLTDILTVIGPAALFILIGLLTSCSVIKEVPVQSIEKIEYRDSLIYVHDTIWVDVPYEKIVEVLPDIDTSYLETSLAKSTAYLNSSSRKLHHTLEQNGQIQAQIDTVFKVQYIDRIIEKEVPIEVIKEVKHIPNWCWWSLIYSIIITILIAVRIYIKCQLRV